jgi:NADH-quinone oxidoreductase subunit A
LRFALAAKAPAQRRFPASAKRQATERMPMPGFVFYLLVFLAVGVFFLFFHLLLGHFIRPNRPDAEKLTIYECGEPTVGSAWIQFDLRYYVVALLFVVFDVEVAFFFPWAVVFGKANELSRPVPDERRAALTQELVPARLNLATLSRELPPPQARSKTVPEDEEQAGQPAPKPSPDGPPGADKKEKKAKGKGPPIPKGLEGPAPGGLVESAAPKKVQEITAIPPETAKTWAWIAFADIMVFFGVLMVGFAYLWRRGDINWVRSTAAEAEA